MSEKPLIDETASANTPTMPESHTEETIVVPVEKPLESAEPHLEESTTTTPQLSPEQAHALFDILSHHQLYSEIKDFKSAAAIQNYGPPFSHPVPEPSSPILALLFNSFVVKLPGMETLPPTFWQERMGTLVAILGEADFSDSYDKGSMGTRKTLATAISSLLEAAARGFLGGCPARDPEDKLQYNLSRAEDLEQAWDKAAEQLTYGDLIDELYDAMAESDKLEDKSPMVQAAVQYTIISLASFVHHLFVLSPDGQYLLRLLSNVNQLIPYMAIRQTLRVGNAATMIKGMMKLILTKLSVTAFTNWVGLSNSKDDGQNLLQQIISQVLTWDNSEFNDIAKSIERDKSGPSKAHLEAINNHIAAPREEHDTFRHLSMRQKKSIVNVIFTSASIAPLEGKEHSQALAYYSAKLSINDRKSLIRVLCRSHPDHMTQLIKDVLAIYDPLIRSIHNGVDLTAGLGDLQNFIDDMIKTVRPSSDNVKAAPSVEDFVALFRKHTPSCLRFLHQVAKNCPDVARDFRAYCKDAVKGFRGDNRESKSGPTGAAGTMTSSFETIFSSLPKEQQQPILSVLDAHQAYLTTLSALSTSRVQTVLDNTSATMYGPGIYLARWHNLLDETLITPSEPEGKVRLGKDVRFIEEEGKRKGKGWWDAADIARKGMEDLPEAPDVSVVVEGLGGKWVEVLRREIMVNRLGFGGE